MSNNRQFLREMLSKTDEQLHQMIHEVNEQKDDLNKSDLKEISDTLEKAHWLIHELDHNVAEKERSTKLPSRFQIGDEVAIRQTSFFAALARVIKVHFSESKVLYDLEVCLNFDPTPRKEETGEIKMISTRIYNVDSALVNLYELAKE